RSRMSAIVPAAVLAKRTPHFGQLSRFGLIGPRPRTTLQAEQLQTCTKRGMFGRGMFGRGMFGRGIGGRCASARVVTSKNGNARARRINPRRRLTRDGDMMGS